MSSNINVSGINENFPIAGVNQSSQPFRDNTRMLKNNLSIASVELSNLGDKRISIIGDASGQTGLLGLSAGNPTPINLQLTATGVVAGTYNGTGNEISLTVDSKGRISQVVLTPKPTRPGVVGTFAATATGTPTLGNIDTITVPSFTFDQYGTLVSTGSDTFNAGIRDYPLAKGSILAGNASGVSSEFPLPTGTFSPADTWVLTWNPLFGTTHSLRWFRMPAVVDNYAEVIQIQQGDGINLDNSDNEYPIVSMDINNLPVYPTPTVQSNTMVSVYDPVAAQHYKIDFTKLASITPTGSYLTKLSDDSAPVLGGDLSVNGRKIIGSNSGITLETTGTGNITLNGQRFPRSAGTNGSYLRIDAAGNLYWDTIDLADFSGVTEITRGVGIETSPASGITTTGTIGLNLLNSTARIPVVEQDYLIFQSLSSVGRATVNELTFQMLDVLFVDPIYGFDDTISGTANRPFRTINYAISRLPTDIGSVKRILLLPGQYTENFSINRSNVSITSLMGADQTFVSGTVSLTPGEETFIDGITFDIYAALDNPTATIIDGTSDINTVHISNCKFYRYPDEFERTLPIAIFEGEATGIVTFTNCSFNGMIVNNLTEGEDPNNPDDTGSFGVIVNNPLTDDDNRLAVRTGAGSRTILNNVTNIECFYHNGGYLEANSIGQVMGIFTDADYDSIPEGEDPEDFDIVRKGLISPANADPLNGIFLKDVSFSFKAALGYGNVMINKTGTASYEFYNVTRSVELDVMNGKRFGFTGSAQLDNSEQYKIVNSTGTVTLDATYSPTYLVNLGANTTINLPIVETIYPRQLVTPLRVIVAQDATGSRTVNFASPNGTISWNGSATMPAPSTGANTITIYEFENLNNLWLANRTFVTV